jgi:hypothetical protein
MSKSLLTAWVALAVLIGSPLVGGLGGAQKGRHPGHPDRRVDQEGRSQALEDQAV